MNRRIRLKTRGKLSNERGQAMVEFALVLPLLLVLLCGILDFGYVLACKNELTHLAGGAARTGAINWYKGEATANSEVNSYINDHAKYGTPTVTITSSGSGSSAYLTVTLTENVSYLTGFTGVITGGRNTVNLKAESSWPVEPYTP